MSILNSHIEAGRELCPQAAGMIPMAVYPARPRKVAPLHPGSGIADILEDVGVSVRKAAAAMGLSPNGLNKVLRGESPVTVETALRVGTYFGNGPDLWLDLQKDYDLWHARIAMKDALKAIEPLPREPMPGLPAE